MDNDGDKIMGCMIAIYRAKQGQWQPIKTSHYTDVK